MTFQPLIPSTGLVGWRFMQRTYDSQLDTFSQSNQLQRDTSAFLEKIANVTSAQDLVADRQLLSVALGAFGLSGDLDNTYFIQKILEEGTIADDSLANKLADDTYHQLSEAFGFGAGEALQTGDSAAMSKIVDAYFENAFEVAVGEQDDTMRIALYAQRELAELASGTESEDTKWYTLMSLPALRSMFETALGLPTSFSQLDIDKQLEVFRDKTRQATGEETIAQFSDPEVVSKVTDLFLARAQIAEFQSTFSAASVALTLLQS